jgi:hypothetical protein
MTPKRPYLVFFRSGPNSLHPRIVGEDPDRNWDCVVNWWGSEPGRASADLLLAGGLNKTDGFHELAMQGRVPWRDYRYILLLDDDVYFAPGDVSRLLRICDEHATYLSQPALRWGTYASHAVTLRNPLCVLRSTSFVEMMAPVFSRAALGDLLDTFTLTRSTWGIDWAWSSRLAGAGRIHVVDAVSVDHTKPVSVQSGAFYQRLRAMGTDPRAEFSDVKARFPGFGGIRTLDEGHRCRAGVPGWIGPALVRLTDRGIRFAHERGWSHSNLGTRGRWHRLEKAAG